jgi:hypothetical protein
MSLEEILCFCAEMGHAHVLRVTQKLIKISTAVPPNLIG